MQPAFSRSSVNVLINKPITTYWIPAFWVDLHPVQDFLQDVVCMPVSAALPEFTIQAYHHCAVRSAQVNAIAHPPSIVSLNYARSGVGEKYEAVCVKLIFH